MKKGLFNTVKSSFTVNDNCKLLSNGRNILICSVFFVLISCMSVSAQQLAAKSNQQLGTDITTSKAVMDDFMDKRFGMFIHFGPVALRGTEIGWSRGKEVPAADYDNLYKEFNPMLFNADEWVKTAKDAGMKYLTITARHHDGFCLWPTKFTDYNIMSSPFKRDIVGELNEACKKQGIKFCIYYSVLDWYHPDYPLTRIGDKLVPKTGADMEKYVVFMKNQLKELVTNYDPYMLWFDGQWEDPWTNERGKDIYQYLKKLKPNLIVNNRLGKEFASVRNKAIDPAQMVGDYDTPEQAIGRLNMNVPWESCFTICKQWSWKSNDLMKPLKECIQTFLKVIGGNGNLLLNVGPMPDGRIEKRQIDRLKEMGTWIDKYGAAIYGTKGGPYEPTAVYATTRKGNLIYLHVFERNSDKLILPPLADAKIKKAHFFNGEPVSFAQNKDFGVLINLPKVLPDPIASVIVLEMDKNIENMEIASF